MSMTETTREEPDGTATARALLLVR
jgi:hypothetical protein